MAIPFIAPDEDDGIDEIIRHLQLLLARLAERRRRAASTPSSPRGMRPQPAAGRVRSAINVHVRNDANESSSASSTSTAELHVDDHVAWRDTIARIPRRRHTTSESSYCCEDRKNQGQDNEEDCIIQVGSVLQTGTDNKDNESIGDDDDDDDDDESKDEFGDGLLSRLLPKSLCGSLWTTAVPVICVVGWHLLRTTYDSM